MHLFLSSAPSRALSSIVLAFIVSVAAAPLSATEGTTDPAAIREAALAALGVTGTGSEAMVDSALRLAACSTALQARPTGPRTVEVHCGDAPGWRVYVPVRVRKEADVVVLTRPVPAGQPITAEHIAMGRRDIAGAGAAVFDDPVEVIGMTAVQGLVPGSALTRTDLANGSLLKRGDPVMLVSRVGGVEVRMSGRALGRAAPGETVAVENLGSRRIIRGRLVGDGLVEVVR
ncbi:MULTISPECIES: flagellar basal body P-ring formation chaperone FlgA [Lysobacter]|uniref:flagellar basal body P-ring formation chaperone FlgA n=1 Tax=Lysobacteraceae TaxID=32033 RepID=UPI001CD141FB|nr:MULTISPECIES: flagellar basal body P-ring formation chaperone FlgA [Lysobacter]